MKLLSPALIILLGLIVYSNALFNNFIWDDRPQIVENKLINSPKYIPIFFLSSLHLDSKEGNLFNFFYRPLPFAFYSILYVLGNGTPVIFHLFQILSHSINAMLLYFLFSKFLNKNFSLPLALIFLVHPANEVTAAHIANLFDVLAFLFGVSALLLIIYKPFNQITNLILMSLFLFLSLLSKETGILFVGIVFLYILFFEQVLSVKAIFSFAFVFSIYAILRIVSSNYYYFNVIKTEVMVDLTLFDRLLSIPKLITYYFKEIFIPSDALISAQVIKKISRNEVIIVFLGMVFIIFLIIKNVLKSKYFLHVLFFMSWFFLGLGMHLQIFKLEDLAAKRWLYFPLAGILGLIGVLITRLNLNPKYEKYLLIPLMILIIGLFSIQTYQMNYLWQDEDLLNTQTINLP